MEELQRVSLGRRHLDSAEAWLRRLIRSVLHSAFGPNYFHAQRQDGTNIINTEIRRHTEGRMEANPGRYMDHVAALDFGQSIAIVLNPMLYEHFRGALLHAYPDGVPEARTFLGRLEAHRNRIAHGGTCSARALEQCICYSNDLIDSIKAYFVEINLERRFNVPTFTRLVDNKGNERLFTEPAPHVQHVDLRDKAEGNLYPGETLIVEVEIDESFEGYAVDWHTFSTPNDVGQGKRIELPIQMKHIGEMLIFSVKVTSNEQWHRLEGRYDDRIDVVYRVLPPPR